MNLRAPVYGPLFCRGFDQGYTIGGARQRMSGEDDEVGNGDYQLMIRQMITELEEVLHVLNA